LSPSTYESCNVHELRIKVEKPLYKINKTEMFKHDKIRDGNVWLVFVNGGQLGW
ncbi:hypothetical protein T4C_7474, partial [Trichinella pseudospiralis]